MEAHHHKFVDGKGSSTRIILPIFMRMIPQYFRSATHHFIEQNLQLTLRKLSVWFELNEMLLNTEKTKVMLITTLQKHLHLHDNILNLTFNNDTLKNVDNDKVLGVHIDNNLTWSIHIQFIVKKISSNMWLLSKLKEYLSLGHRVQFYKTYIQLHIDYCSTVWGGTSHSNLNRIYRLQKRAVKIILDYEYNNGIACSMDEVKILNIYERVFLRKAKFMFKISKSITPSYINAMFTLRPINGERGGSVVECRTPEREVRGSKPTAAVLCP